MFVFQSNGLKKFREEAGLTQKDLAFQLGYNTAQFVSNIENGKANIPSKDIPTIAKVLKIQTIELANLKLLDFVLKLARDAKAPDLKKHAKLITRYEQNLKEIISEKNLESIFRYRKIAL